MKRLKEIFGLALFLFLLINSTAYSNNFKMQSNESDSLKLLEKYSLFSEYHKNKEYADALPFGWEVLKINPDKFKKWIYYKMEDCLWYLHDSTDITPETKKSLEDTVIYFYDLALQHYPEEKAYFQSHKAYIMETWLHMPIDTVIAAYELAIKYDKNLSPYYYDRLGQLYIKKSETDKNYKSKAVDLYSYLAEREPDNPRWNEILGNIVEDINELVRIAKKNWLNDKNNLAKAWKFASLAIRAGEYKEAIEGLEFLVEKSPETINYWNQLATAYQKTGDDKKAEKAYLKLIELEPGKKEHYLNLGIIYSDEGRYSLARKYYTKASKIGNGWGLPIFYEGYLYEQAARNCDQGFETKVVYQLALDTYRKAKRLDPTLTQAQDRINALKAVVPTKEDYFFRKYKSGDVIPITGDCFKWIGKSITVP